MTDDDKIDYIQSRVDTAIDKIHDVGAALQAHATDFAAHSKQDEHMYEELRRANDILSENTASLKAHMRRTDLLEDYMKKMDARFMPVEVDHQNKVAVQDWVGVKLKFIAKLGAAAAALGTLSVAAKLLIEYILTH